MLYSLWGCLLWVCVLFLSYLCGSACCSKRLNCIWCFDWMICLFGSVGFTEWEFGSFPLWCVIGACQRCSFDVKLPENWSQNGQILVELLIGSGNGDILVVRWFWNDGGLETMWNVCFWMPSRHDWQCKLSSVVVGGGCNTT